MCFFLLFCSDEQRNAGHEEGMKEGKKEAAATAAAATTRAAPPMYDGAVCSWIRTGAYLLAFALLLCNNH
jgi:hypothetical protein